MELAAQLLALIFWTECLVSSVVQAVTRQRVMHLLIARLSQHAGVKSLLADAKLQRAKKALLAVVKNLYVAVSQRQKVAKTRAIHLLQKAAVDYSRNCSQ
ncbi:MAG: hypothetical protein VX694_00025 [Planctomycetota bacterium]|nr:hypothetical protein [Planctomycetota bacterium]